MNMLLKSEFTKHLINCNSPSLQNFKEWIFHPGMLFGSMDKWWISGKRNTPHEGIDLCYFVNQQGQINNLNNTTIIPAIFDGAISAIIDDYLGKSIIIEHTLKNQVWSFCTIFGHVIPKSGITVDSNIKQGEPIASISGMEKSKSKIFPHLHISLGRVSGRISYRELDWSIISDPEKFSLQDPISLINNNYKVLTKF